MKIKEKVLLIEDERTIRGFMQAILTANGYDVLMAGTGAMANTMISSHCPDLIILDLGLPDMDGMTILRSVREWSKVPILVVSARSHERDKVEALDAGADDYLTKPFGTEELLARIRGETTVVKSDPPKHNGRTERRPTNWDRLLAAGARPSNRNQGLDATEEQRCAGLIKAAFYEKWHPRPPWTMDLKKMTLHVEFDKQGRVKAFRLTGSSGDAAADRTVLSAARSVGRVSGLTAAYLERHPTSTIIFEVEPQ